jgi:histone deacetylase 7A, putative
MIIIKKHFAKNEEIKKVDLMNSAVSKFEGQTVLFLLLLDLFFCFLLLLLFCYLSSSDLLRQREITKDKDTDMRTNITNVATSVSSPTISVSQGNIHNGTGSSATLYEQQKYFEQQLLQLKQHQEMQQQLLLQQFQQQQKQMKEQHEKQLQGRIRVSYKKAQIYFALIIFYSFLKSIINIKAIVKRVCYLITYLKLVFLS